MHPCAPGGGGVCGDRPAQPNDQKGSFSGSFSGGGGHPSGGSSRPRYTGNAASAYQQGLSFTNNYSAGQRLALVQTIDYSMLPQTPEERLQIILAFEQGLADAGINFDSKEFKSGYDLQYLLHDMGGVGPQGAAGGGSAAASTAKAIKAARASGLQPPKGQRILGCRGNSFVPTTQVLMADGSRKSIEDVEVGDKVLATDPVTGEQSAKTVVFTIIGEGPKDLVEITVDTATEKQPDADTDDTGLYGNGGIPGPTATGDLIFATEGHPFWVPNLDEWVEAGELQPGTWIQTTAGTWVQVTSVKAWTQSVTVNNLTVQDAHTYYALAGDTPVLVHNSNCFNTTAGEAVKFLKPTQKTRTWEQEAALEDLSNDDLIKAIQKPADGEEILVLRDSRQLGGNHRIDELRRRVEDGRIDSETPIKIRWYDPYTDG
ncbi:Hint domain-containing protein [Nocardiopsis rhodophaea]|uniref:Hint domain-containing protein n=1 Tax=Nocardiopsis rhodophaea TaxID=280238 RepID=UPI0031E46694